MQYGGTKRKNKQYIIAILDLGTSKTVNAVEQPSAFFDFAEPNFFKRFEKFFRYCCHGSVSGDFGGVPPTSPALCKNQYRYNSGL